MHHFDDEASKSRSRQQRPDSNTDSNSNPNSNVLVEQPTPQPPTSAMVGLTTSSFSRSDRTKTDSIDLGYDSSSFLSTTSSAGNEQSLISDGINAVISGKTTADLASVDSGLDIQDTFSHLSLVSDTSANIITSQQQTSTTTSSTIPNNVQDSIWLDAFFQDQDGDTHLHLAIIQGYVDAVFTLIQLAPHPQYLDIQNDLCQSPLHLSVLTRQPLITRRLLVAGANPHPRDRCGNMPVHVACEQGDLDIVRQLTVPISSGQGDPKRRYYHQQQHLQQRHHRQQRHAAPATARTPSNLEARNYEGLRCVHIAAIKGHRDVLRHLVAYGANVNAQEDRSGRTALHLAVETRNVHVVQFLVAECGADVNAVTYSGHSAIQLARGPNPRMTDTLRQLGALPPQETASSDSSESDSDNMDHSDCDLPKMNGDPRW